MADERSDADRLPDTLAGRDAEKGSQKSSTKRGEKTVEKTSAPAPPVLPAGKLG